MSEAPKLPDLIMSNRSDFVSHFVKLTCGFDPEVIACMVWRLANTQWSAGFNQAMKDPDFESALDEVAAPDDESRGEK